MATIYTRPLTVGEEERINKLLDEPITLSRTEKKETILEFEPAQKKELYRILKGMKIRVS